jgi:hypothetical protein
MRRIEKNHILGIASALLLILFNTNTLYAFNKAQPIVKNIVTDVTLQKPQKTEKPAAIIETQPSAKDTQAVIREAQRESISLTYSEELFAHTPKPDENEKEFLNDLVTFIEKTVPEPYSIADPTSYEGPKTYAYIFPRIGFIKYKWNQFFEWFKVKDNSRNSGSEREQLRQEWEALLGIDLFHPYYKYKEARKAFKERCTFDTSDILPGIPKMDVTPEIKDKKLYVTFSKKF